MRRNNANWSFGKSVAVITAVGLPLITLALWFGGIIGKRPCPICLYTELSLIAAVIITGFFVLQFRKPRPKHGGGFNQP